MSAEQAPGPDRQLLPLSSSSEAGRTEAVRRLLAELPDGDRDAAALETVLQSAWRLPPQRYRMAVLTSGVGELRTQLQAYLDGTGSRDVIVGSGPVERPPSVAFLYSGQGGQYPGMGLGLYRREPVFRTVIDRCAAAAEPVLSGGLPAALWPPEGEEGIQCRMPQAKLGTFAVSMALTQLWASWGVRPAAVLGFSSGEYTAACVSGALSLPDAVRLLAAEAALTERVHSGAIAVVDMPEEAAVAALVGVRDKVGVGSVISDSEVTLSGDSATLASLQERFGTGGRRWVYLPVPQGLHSPLQQPVAEELAAAVRSTTFTPPTVPMVSTVTGALVGRSTLSDPGHWQQHLTGTVRFRDAMQVLAEAGCDAFVEVGPGRALAGIGPRALPGRAGAWWESLGRSADGQAPMLRALAGLYVRGEHIARPGRGG